MSNYEWEDEPEALDTAPGSGARTGAMLCHLAAFAGLLGIPFGNIVGPLIVWLIKKNESPFIDDQGREALNFQISLYLYTVAAVIAFAILAALLTITVIGLPIVMLLVLLAGPVIAILWVAWFVITIIAALRANDGIAYRYPFCIRLL